MKKTIDFIELSKLVKDGKQPNKIVAQSRRGAIIPFQWNENREEYMAYGRDFLFKCDTFSGLAKWKFEYEEPILTDKEREYLSAVIKPWKENVKHIFKYNSAFIPGERIIINLKGDLQAYLPYFEKGKYYEGMKLNEKYTVEELGL